MRYILASGLKPVLASGFLGVVFFFSREVTWDLLSLVALGFSGTRVSAMRLLVLIDGLQSYLGEQGTTIASGPLCRVHSSHLSFWFRVLFVTLLMCQRFSNSQESQGRQLQVVREDVLIQKAD